MKQITVILRTPCSALGTDAEPLWGGLPVAMARAIHVLETSTAHRIAILGQFPVGNLAENKKEFASHKPFVDLEPTS